LRNPSRFRASQSDGFRKSSTYPTGCLIDGGHRAKAPLPTYRFCPTGKSLKICPALPRKIFRFPRRANHLYKLAPSRPQRGGSRSSRTRGGTRWTRQRRHAQWSQGGPFRARELVTARRRTAVSRTAKSCGPDAPTLASSFCGGERRPTGRTSPPIRKATVARKPGHRGEREGSR